MTEKMKELLDKFPFEAVSQRMNQKPRWKYGRDVLEVPGPERLRTVAARLIIEASKNPAAEPSSGGLHVKIAAGTITLWFGRNAKDIWAKAEVRG